MADTVAKTALGPRPGPYILKFWQGSVEIVLRSLAVIGGVASLIASSYALHQLLTFPEDAIQPENVVLVDNLRERDLQFNSQAGAGTGIAVSILLIFLGITVIIVRFLNFGIVNAKSKIVWSIGTTLFSTLMLCFVMLWLMYYLIQKWNNKLIKETLKSAI